VPQLTPEQVLASHGLAPGTPQVLDAGSGLAVTSWSRPPKRDR